MEAWNSRKLKEMCTKITVGHVGSMADQYRAEGIPMLRSQNIHPFRLNFDNLKFIDENFHAKLKKSALQPGDVAVVRTGYPGTAAVVPPSLGIANCSDLVIVRPGKELNSHFLAAIFNSAFGKNLVSGNLVGAAQQHFNVTVVKELKLQFPPRIVQDKIAGVLSAYDDLIENNRRRIAILENMAEEIYREWFVRMRFPGHQNAKFEKGVPVGWEIKRLNEILTLSYGKALKSDDRQPGNIPVYGSGGVVGYHDRALVNRPGLIVGRKGNVGSVYLSDEPFFPIDTVYYVESRLSLLYLFFFLQSMNFINNDAAVPGLNRNQAYSNQCFSPPRELIDQFDAIVANINEKAKTLRRSNSVLGKTRDALLTRLISGKLPVDELDIQLPPSMTEIVAEEASEELVHA